MRTFNIFRVVLFLSVTLGITFSTGLYDGANAQEEKIAGFTSSCAGNFVATAVDTNGDNIPGSIATLDCMADKKLRRHSLVVYFELVQSNPQPKKPCNVDDKTTGTQFELVQGQGSSIATRIRNLKQGKPQDPDQIYTTLTKIIHCVDLTSGRFSNIGEGKIDGGAGRFAGKTGTLTFNTTGHFNAQPPLFWGAISSNENIVTFGP